MRKIEVLIEQTTIKAGSELIRLWIDLESINKEILSFQFERTKYVFAKEQLLSYTISKYGLHSVSSSDGDTRYQQACSF